MWLTACSTVAQVLAEVKDLPSEPDYDTVKALEYTRALFTETLRYVAHGRLRGRVGAQCLTCCCSCVPMCSLHPSVPKDGAEAASDCTLPSGARVKKLVRRAAVPWRVCAAHVLTGRRAFPAHARTT